MAVNNWETKTYRPAWRSFFYPHILSMIVIFLIACVVSFKVSMEGRTLAILWLAVLVALLVIFLFMLVRRMGSSLIVRREEVAYEQGLFSRESPEIGFEDIRTIYVSQTFIQRIFNLGTLSIASSGTDGKEIVIKDMPDPNAIRDEIQERKRSLPQRPAAPTEEKTETKEVNTENAPAQ